MLQLTLLKHALVINFSIIIIVIVIINLFKIVSYNTSVLLEFKLWFTMKEQQLSSGSTSSFMTIIEEVGSPVAATVVVMVVIDIDGSVSSSRCDLQHQWCCKYTIAKDLTIHRQGTCSIRFNVTAIHRTENYYCFIQLVDSALSRSGMHLISLL